MLLHIRQDRKTRACHNLESLLPSKNLPYEKHGTRRMRSTPRHNKGVEIYTVWPWPAEFRPLFAVRST
jgi:hypothetical protein